MCTMYRCRASVFNQLTSGKTIQDRLDFKTSQQENEIEYGAVYEYDAV